MCGMGRLLEIATREKSRAPLDLRERAQVTAARGVDDDYRGGNTGRNVVVLGREGWEAACAALGRDVDWTVRRANLLVEGVALAETTGRRLRVGDVLLEITGECEPCARMEEAVSGLRVALASDWRAGVMCVVVEEGEIAAGDDVTLEAAAG